MDRRKFITAASTALFAGAAMQLLGCNESASLLDAGSIPIPPDNGNGLPVPEYPPVPDLTPVKNPVAASVVDRAAVISTAADPRHVALVTSAQQEAGAALTLHIQGSAPHDHTVTLTAQDVMNIKNGVQVAKTSSASGHTHLVTWAMVSAILPHVYNVPPGGA